MTPRKTPAESLLDTEDIDPAPRRPPAFTLDTTAYQFIRPLERRGNGEVLWLAERQVREGLRGLVAIKTVRSPSTFERRQRLIQEVQLASRLSHPAIAAVHHLKVLKDQPYIIMEYVEGPSLDTLVTAAATAGAGLPEPFTLYVAAEVADALHHAHTLMDDENRGLGIVHRDVSPRNVRLDQKTGAVKLTNFGAAYSLLVGREESPRSLLKGDVAYASPEYLHRGQLDARSDLFSLGLLLVELLTGRHLLDVEGDAPTPDGARRARPEETPSLPFERMRALMARFTPEDVERAVLAQPEALKAVVHRLLRHKPAERYGSAAEVRDVLRGALAHPGRPYGRQEAAEEVQRLLSAATVLRGHAELAEGGLLPDTLEEHEITPVEGEDEA